MDINQKRKILAKIQKLQTQIEELEDVRIRLASAEYVSASTSSGTGSKSYTRADIGKITDALADLRKSLKSCRKLLSGCGSIMTSSTYIIYS